METTLIIKRHGYWTEKRICFESSITIMTTLHTDGKKRDLLSETNSSNNF